VTPDEVARLDQELAAEYEAMLAGARERAIENFTRPVRQPRGTFRPFRRGEGIIRPPDYDDESEY
jgi:hypothetical protein